MGQWRDISAIRREYGDLSLSEDSALPDPFAQFTLWFEDVLKVEKSDPTAMVLSTVDEKGYPDSRVVLLKSIDEDGLVFFTNYLSAKAMQLKHCPYAAVLFYWPQMARQIRIRGKVKKILTSESDAYFSTRPYKSQISAIASPQSQQLTDRDELLQKINQLIEKHGQKPILRPDYWGGYRIHPEEFEFWQGRDNRLHDRIHYSFSNQSWEIRRLAP